MHFGYLARDYLQFWIDTLTLAWKWIEALITLN